MKITSISYQKAFVVGPYLQEKIGMEAQIDDGEDVQAKMLTLKNLVEDFHKRNNPAFLTDAAPIEWSVPINPAMDTPIKSIDRKAIERLEILIDNATSEELATYAEQAMKLGLSEHYWNRYKQLLKQ